MFYVFFLAEWIFENKLLTLLGLCLFSFVIATICLSVQTSDLKDEIAKCQKQQSEQKPDDHKPSGDVAPETPSEIAQDANQKSSKENPSEDTPKSEHTQRHSKARSSSSFSSSF